MSFNRPPSEPFGSGEATRLASPPATSSEPTAEPPGHAIRVPFLRAGSTPGNGSFCGCQEDAATGNSKISGPAPHGDDKAPQMASAPHRRGRILEYTGLEPIDEEQYWFR
jgi:hypothetical protein